MRTVLPRQLGPGAGGVIAYFRAGCFAVRRDRFWAVGGFDPAMRFSEVSELGMRLGQSLSGQANAVTHVARSLVSVELPEGEGLGGSLDLAGVLRRTSAADGRVHPRQAPGR